jgi:hypothetical protein
MQLCKQGGVAALREQRRRLEEGGEIPEQLIEQLVNKGSCSEPKCSTYSEVLVLKKPQALIGLLAALGTAIGVLVAVVGLPYGRADYTAFAALYHGPTNTVGTFHMALDCNTATTADDTLCTVLLTGGAQTTTVDVTFGNSTAGSSIVAAFNLTVVDPDTTRLDAVTPGSCLAPKLSCNPNFLDTGESTEGLGGTAWACDPVLADIDAVNGNGDDSLASCLNPTDAPTLTAVPGHLDLVRVTYDVPIAAAVGSVTLILKDVNVFDETVTEIQSCNPISTTAGPCFSTTIDFIVPPPTATPTDTSTPVPATDTPTTVPTDTPTNTPVPPTFTPTPSDSGLQKVAEGNANNTGPGPSANLWICQTGPCSGPGEGSLHVVERALNVITQDDNNDTIADGLGAYEFSVEYDNFVISSVNPCDIVFGPTGAGAARGPVDELNTSSPANADCTPDPGATNNGQCTNSIITENIVHFGCVTAGQIVGPNGNFDVASLELIPHEDLSNDLFPGNNNGVLTVIKDNGCELVNVFGHAIPGSVNGGLTVLCGDLAVTVRILEGDIDLNCTVNGADAQAIAVRYGGFFGGLAYSKWFDLEPQFHDLDIDIKDIQKVFGRIGSTCQTPIPAQPPLAPPTGFGD